MRRTNLAVLTILIASFGCHKHTKSNERTSDTPTARTATMASATSTTPNASAAPSPLKSSVDPPAVPERQTFVPADLKPGERRPLIVALHGLGASGQTAFDVLGLAAFGRNHRVIVVAPDGTVDSAGRRFWDAGLACCNFDRRPVDDVARLDALIDAWIARPDVDPKRVYVIGHSNGGFMAHRLACESSDRIAAVVSVAGAGPLLSEHCAPSSSIAVLEVHGDADPIVRYAGGSVFDRGDLARFPSAHETFEGWAKRLDCSGEPERGADVDLDPAIPGAETEVLAYTHCARGAVALWTAHGASHYIGTRPSALERIWPFLESHPKS